MSNQAELDPRNQEAINAALVSDWEKAILINSDLSEEYPDDVNVLNRLGHAYAELGQVNKSSSIYKKILEIDPYNPIAKRNLERLATLRGSEIKVKETRPSVDPDTFIEEPGKTKTIDVVDLAMPKVLIVLRTGDKVTLNPNKKEITVISEDNHRLGKLDGLWGEEIAQALRLGSQFNAIVKAVKVGKDQANSTLSVFLRETKRSKRLAHPTFPIESNNFTPFVREDSISYLKEHEAPNSTETNESAGETDLEEIPSEEGTPNEPHPIELEEPLPEMIEDEEDFSPK